MGVLDKLAGNPFAGGQPVMHDAPVPPVPWYRQVGARYGPTEFTMDAIAKLIGVPVSNIMSGRLHDSAAAPRDAVPISDDPREAQAVAGQNRSNAASALGHGMEAGGLASLGSVGAPHVPNALGANRFTLDYFGQPVKMVGNPSKGELAGFLGRTKYKAARRIVDKDTGDVYVWDAADPALHEMVAKELGINPKTATMDTIGLD